MTLKTLVAGAALAAAAHAAAPEPGLLFYLSGEHGTTADYSAGGTPRPNFEFGVTPIPDGAKGQALRCDNLERLAYWAPGNIYAQRGTLSFFWRSRDPVGPTPFPVFRVGYADHSSWDMVFLRIDYNGHGFDAFVTDASLSRTRVSTTLAAFPAPNAWTHLILTWDETEGIRFYIDGRLAAAKAAKAVYNLALDQFGPHSRIISPHNVQSDYNFVRGGDIDEVRIYDHAVTDADAASLARGDGLAPGSGAPVRDLNEARWDQEWALRYGWERPDALPAYYPVGDLAVRKVEIHDAWDLKRWYWKANDGIRETTWPGVYNRSRLPGRNDYFQLPDWDCYSLSGKSITFVLPDEPWNHIEMSGAAWGRLSLIRDPNWQPGSVANDSSRDEPLFDRPEGRERSIHELTERTGGKLRFDNVIQEQPIGEFSVYHVSAGREPAGETGLEFVVGAAAGPAPDARPSVALLQRYVSGRFAPDERATVVAEPVRVGAASPPLASERGRAVAGVADPGQIARSGTDLPGSATPATARSAADNDSGQMSEQAAGRRFHSDPDAAVAGYLQPETNYEASIDQRPAERLLPLVHVLIPNELGGGRTLDAIDGGLDGVVLELPALPVRPSRGGLFPLNVQVKDPLWPLRDLCDFTFSVKPGEGRRIWLDLRDRLLPHGRGLYLTIAGSGADFGPASLRGMRVKLVFKPKADALAEHSLDRFTQLRDAYAMLVEEHPFGPRFNLWNRFQADLDDLLRVNPTYPQVQNYAAVALRDHPRPAYHQPVPPAGVPLWAFRQVEALRRAARFANWWIDHRQVANGEYGGGLSDDTDLTNTWPGIALMGNNPEKFGRALEAEVDACYRQGMITNGFPSIQADELHSYEEGTNCLGQNLILNFGSPRMLERAMENARSIDWLTAVNPAGHRHIKSSYYNGLKMATDSVWGYAKAYGYLILQPDQLLIDYNGSPHARQVELEIADGLLAHRRLGADGRYELPSAIHWADDKDSTSTRAYFPWPLFWSAYKWTGQQKYLNVLLDGGTTSIMAVNANLLDLAHLRGEWGPRIARGERGRATESRVADARGRAAPHVERENSAEQFQWQVTGDKRPLEKLYARLIEQMDLEEYINTVGSLWIDRINVPHVDLQRGRLGGVALVRNGTFPGHVVSWRFAAPATETSVAALVPESTRTSFKVILYNLDTEPVRTTMTGWNVDPGLWEFVQGVDDQGDDRAHRALASRTAAFGRSEDVELTLPPRTTTILTAQLRTAGTPYWQRPDPGIDPQDVIIHGREVLVRVHNVGAVASPATKLVIKDAAGEVLATEIVAPIDAPNDLLPKWRDVRLTLPDGARLAGGSVELDPGHAIEEITRRNDRVWLPRE